MPTGPRKCGSPCTRDTDHTSTTCGEGLLAGFSLPRAQGKAQGFHLPSPKMHPDAASHSPRGSACLQGHPCQGGTGWEAFAPSLLPSVAEIPITRRSRGCGEAQGWRRSPARRLHPVLSAAGAAAGSAPCAWPGLKGQGAITWQGKQGQPLRSRNGRGGPAALVPGTAKARHPCRRRGERGRVEAKPGTGEPRCRASQAATGREARESRTISGRPWPRSRCTARILTPSSTRPPRAGLGFASPFLVQGTPSSHSRH